MIRKCVLAVFLMVAQVQISCTDHCGKGYPNLSRISALEASATTYDSLGRSIFGSDSATYDVAALLITISELDYIGRAKEKHKRFSLIPSAYACDPALPRPTQRIDEISITSEAEVYSGGQTYAPGANLSGLFQVKGLYSLVGEYTVQEFINLHKDNPEVFGYGGDRMIFQLTDAPDSAMHHKVTLQYTFSNAQVVETNSVDFVVVL